MKNLGPLFEIKGGIVKLFDLDESASVNLTVPDVVASSITYTLPGAFPAGDGYRLICTTAGVMSWASSANLSTGSGVTITSGSGTAALLVAATLAVDQAFTPTWTGLHIYTTNGIKFNFTNAGDTIWTSYLGANAQPSLQVTGDGSMFWGPGIGIVDVALSRSSAGVLNITGNLDISGLTASRVLSTDSNGVLTSVGAPAVNGYVLSSTTAGVLSWVVQGAPAGADLTASTGLTITAGSGTGALLVAATLAVNQAFTPTWTGLHTFNSSVTRFGSTDSYSAGPASLLEGYVKYNSSGTFATVSQILMGKENVTDGNNAGFISFLTRPNGGTATERMRITSSGIVNISNLTASKFVGTDSSKNLVSVDAPTATSVEVIGSSTDYTFSTSGVLEEVDFGSGDPTLNLPSAGTYFLYGTVTYNQVIGGSIAFESQFKNTTDTAFVGVNTLTYIGSAALNCIVTIASAKTFKLFALCSSTVGTPKVVAAKTLVGYIKLS